MAPGHPSPALPSYCAQQTFEKIVNYGLLSGDACQIDGRDTVFCDVSLRGFWLRKWFMQTPLERIVALFSELAAKLADGTLAVDVEAVYPIRRIKEAVAHAARGGRTGKILVSFAEVNRESDVP
jgi:NADPH:quinone reductase-like Zn-dependent oxidoreductase